MKKYTKWAGPFFQAVVSAVLLIMLVISGFIPVKYLGIALAAMVLLLAITVLASMTGNRSARILGGILAFLVCAFLIFAAFNLQRVMSTLDRISGTNTQLENMVVVVDDQNTALDLRETSGFRFGVYEGSNGDYMKEVINEVREENGDAELNIQYYDSPVDLAESLLAGEVDAAICNKAYSDLLDEAIEDYSSNTKIIHEKGFETQIEAVGESEKNLVITEDPFNVLISGIDVEGPISSTSRSDVNILMTVNPVTHKILLTTTPRDYYVHIPGISGDSRDKLTHAGIYGVNASMKTLESLYGIDIDHYIRINFDSLIRLVDVLGGVDVHSDYEFDGGGFHFVQGENHLNGEQALAFSRIRYAFKDGDIQRGKNQMMVLTAILDKLQSPALLKNPYMVLDVVGESMQTSFTTSQITDAIAWQLDTGNGWQIDRQSVTGSGDRLQTFSMAGRDLYVMWPDEDSVNAASERILQEME